ncbi:TonB-dependent receptor [Sphingomonas sp. JC676]|uniref:TonB-dependent receptor plug domain-containing protein n=1 Tax=Sphingomonas sp. JC676 TaxID=2768065 RepID=UPI0016578D1E|nr:TonB-dependent receptor [Sphingomonas sp. JC676]MBC9032469.1 TonB-dependent receptor [Sphingomonas sp. JC676]
MTRKSRIDLAAGASFLGLALALASPAAAQDQPAVQDQPVAQTAPPATDTADQGDQGGEIVVTGTLFRQTSTATPSPVTVLSAQDMARSGQTTIADAVRSISSDNSGSIPTAFSNGFARGSAGVSLRGLSVNSTLVLVDGLRTANYALADDGQKSFVDLNTIPQSLVDRVEVLRDGASSTYGADAIGGVVNLIMKKEFQGIEGSGEIGTTEKGDGISQRANLTVGTGTLDEKGWNAYLNFEYQRDTNISLSDRGFPYNTQDLRSIGGVNRAPGRPGTNNGSIYAVVRPGHLADPADPLSGIPDGVAQVLNPAGCGALATTVVAPGTSTATSGTFCQQDLNVYGDLQPSQIRAGVTGRVTVKINDTSTAYASVSYFADKVSAALPPRQIRSTVPINTNGITLPVLLANGQLNPNNPFASMGQVALINYAFGDIPAHAESLNHVLRGVISIEGEFDGGWSYQVAGVAAHTWLDSRRFGFINIPALQNAIATGAYNFVNPSMNSVDVRNALSPTIIKQSTTDLDMVQAVVTKELFDLPGGPLNLGVGGSLRYEAVSDPNENANQDVLGLGSSFAFGNHTVTAAFFELQAPIIKQLEVDVSGRYDHYSEGFNHFSPKVGVKVTPIQQVVLRGTYSKGFRAPQFAENGSSAQLGFTTLDISAVNDAGYQAFVAAHGGATNPYVQAYNLGANTIGNPDVQPETSESYTFGAVIQPLPWLTLTADYYHISKDDVIIQAQPGPALDAYFNGRPLPVGYVLTFDQPDPAFPNAPLRPTIVGAPYVNADSLVTEGIDASIEAKFRLAPEIRLTTAVNVTDIFHYKFTTGGQTFEYVGTQSPYTLSSGAGTPKWRGNWQTSLEWGPATLTGTVYYVSGYDSIGFDQDPTGGCLYPQDPSASAKEIVDCHTGSFTYGNVQADYQFNDKINAFLTVINVTGEKAPLNPAAYAGPPANYNPTYTQVGIVGRVFRFGVRAKF